MALTADREVDHYIDPEVRAFRAIGGCVFHKGALLALTSSGFACPIDALPPDGGSRHANWIPMEPEASSFCGIAFEERDTRTGGDGSYCIRAHTQGDFALPVLGVKQKHVLRSVYAVDDEVCSLEIVGPRVGVVIDMLDKDLALVRLQVGHS